MSSVNIFPVGTEYDKSKKKWKKFPRLDKGVNWQTYDASEDELNKSSNIGIVIPRGVMIIDLDTDKGVTCSQVEGALGCSLDWDNAELQQTISGGYHYGFRISDDVTIKQGTDLLGVIGFDTRVTSKGWICSGEGYTASGFEDVSDILGAADDWLPELPEGAIKLLSENDNSVLSGDDDDNALEVAIAEETVGLSIEEMESYLGALDISYCQGDQWLKTSMAIYHETKGSDEGYIVFDNFSRRHPESYDQDMNKRRWESFSTNKRSNPITFASVIKWAGGRKKVESVVKRVEFSDQINDATSTIELTKILESIGAECINGLNADMLVKDIQKKFKQIEGSAPSLPSIKKIIKANRPDENNGDFVDNYVFVTNTGEYMNKETKTTMGPRSFDVSYNRITPLNADGDKQSATTYSNEIIKCVDNTMYAPMFDIVFRYEGLDYVNLYKKSRLEPVEIGTTNIVERVKKHIAHLLPDHGEQQLVINYLAHNVQFPGKKIQWSIVLQGVQGDGKSFLSEMMQAVMGLDNVRTMNAKSLDGQFTGWASGQCMTFIEELKLDNYRKYEVLNNLKPYISNSIVEIERKGKDHQVVMNTTNYFSFTNYKDSLPLDDTDRRYLILFSQWQSSRKLEKFISDNPNYYSSLYTDMQNNAGELLTWLTDHMVPDTFKAIRRAPKTAAKTAMLELNKSDGYLLVEDAINEFSCFDINSEVVNITKLAREVTFEWSKSEQDNFPKTNMLKHILCEMGYHLMGTVKDAQSKNNRIYTKDDGFTTADYRKIEPKK